MIDTFLYTISSYVIVLYFINYVMHLSYLLYNIFI